MKKIHIIITLAIIITIISSLIFKKESTQTLKMINQNTLNPSGEGVKVLGTFTEKIEEQNKTQYQQKKKTIKPKKVVFEKFKLYSLLNSYRKDHKLSPLRVDQHLEISATKKVEDMIENNYFSHEDINNVESWYLFKTSGYEFKTAGENLSSGINTPWQVFDAWKNSKLHNAQLLNKTYFDMGIAVNCELYRIANKPSCIVVLHLGSK